LAEAWCFVRASQKTCPRAKNGSAGGATLTNTAEDRQTANNSITGRDVVDLTPHSFYCTGCFVSEEHWHGCGVEPFYEMEITVADA
jgi:hypothetical protein